MFDPVGNASWSCDGIHRRDLLRVGSLSLGSLSLPQLLAHRAHASTDARKTSVIYIELAGGRPSSRRTIPSQMLPWNTVGHWER